MLRTDSPCSALRHHVIVALTRRAARRERGRSSRRQQRAAQATEATEGTGLHRRRDRDLGDLGLSRARCRTWTRRGLRELMSIITPSRLWRGVWRAGGAADTYSPSPPGEIAIRAISSDLEREIGHGLDVVCASGCRSSRRRGFGEAWGALAAPPPPTPLHLETRSRSERSRAISGEVSDMDSTRPA